MASLRLDGQTKQLLARRANHMLIAGHGIHQAVQRLGIEHLDVVLLDVSQAKAEAIMLGDNRHSELSKGNRNREAELLRESTQTSRSPQVSAMPRRRPRYRTDRFPNANRPRGPLACSRYV
jgi:hypothetical protein